MWIEGKNLSSKTEESLSVKLLNMLPISFGLVCSILEDNVNMCQIATKFMSHTCSLFSAHEVPNTK
jgi:hypothetical protein